MARERYQFGSVKLVTRKDGHQVWVAGPAENRSKPRLSTQNRHISAQAEIGSPALA